MKISCFQNYISVIIKKGILHNIGVSNFNIQQFENLYSKCKIKPAVNQIEVHLLYQQNKLRKELKKYGTIVEAWSPLVAGANSIFSNDILVKIGNKYGKSPAQIVLKFLVQNDIVIIPKTRQKDRMIENIDLFDFELSNDEMQLLQTFDTNESKFGWYD